MQKQLTCEQVSALMQFYLENKLSYKLSEYVAQHLRNCPSCMEKYNKLKNMLDKFVEINNEDIPNPYITKQYQEFKSNLSAYLDNELNDEESIKVKKLAISNPLARQDLENIYTFKKLLHNSFEKTKNEFKNDYSKSIICKIQMECNDGEMDIGFYRLAAAFLVIITCIAAGIIGILYF